MRGLCFEGTEKVGLRDLPDPRVEDPQDVVVRVETAGLCGSDLHPFFGREQGLDHGTVMGHEFVGTVVDVGAQVETIAVGQRVFSPFTTSCGRCVYCVAGLTSRCEAGQLFGWREGGKGLHGAQAEFVRVPLADGTLMHVPADVDDDTALLLGDNLSTGFYCADQVGIRPDGDYAVVGCGTVGLLAIAAAFRLGAQRVFAFDPVVQRLQIANNLGANAYADEGEFRAALDEATQGRGVDGVMEVVGLPEAQRTAFDILRPGGTMSVVGCHCGPHFAFGPSDAYDKNLTYRSGRCPARHYMSILAGQLPEWKIDLSWCVTHRFALDDGARAYTVFSGRQDGCIKAVLDIGGREK